MRRGLLAAVAVAVMATVGSCAPAYAAPPPPKPLADVVNDWNSAIGVAANNVGLATGGATIGGSLVGGVAGCLAGGAVGAALMTPVFLPGWAGSCIAGAAVGAGLGAAVAEVVIGGPVLIGSAVQAYQTLHAAGDVAEAMR